MLKGSCLCGDIRFEVSGPLLGQANACHCTQCRKTSGHHVAATWALREDIAMETADALRWYRSSAAARRGFCATCGSNLFWDADGDPHLSISAGALEGPTGLRLAGHIWCASKGDYYDIADGLPQAGGGDLDLAGR